MVRTLSPLAAARPLVRAQFAPVFWEPLPGSGERVAAIILVAPDIESSALLAPAAHVVLNARRLRAMLGAQRGDSALGILNETARFMTERLAAGEDIQQCKPLFRHFTVGPVRQVRGFTPEQALDAAVQSVAAFGTAEDIIEDMITTPNSATVTTREFLQRVQVAFAPADDDRRKRFGRQVSTKVGDFTIDYVPLRNFVQFATAPVTERQEPYMRREAEAKILELITVKQTFEEMLTAPALVINTAPLAALAGAGDEEGPKVAERTLAFYRGLSEAHHVALVEVSSHEEAVLTLGMLEQGANARKRG